MGNPFDWRISDIEQKANNAERRLHELDSLRSNVDSLERANWELSARVAELCSQLEEAKGRICWLENTTGEHNDI